MTIWFCVAIFLVPISMIRWYGPMMAYDGPMMGLWAYDNLMSRDVSRCLAMSRGPRDAASFMSSSAWRGAFGEFGLGHLGQLSLSLSRFPNGPKVRGIIPCPFHVPSMFSRKLQETESQERQMEHRKSKHAATHIMVWSSKRTHRELRRL